MNKDGHIRHPLLEQYRYINETGVKVKMSRISKFDVLLLMQQLDDLLENRKEEKSKDKKTKKRGNQ